jgi:hypothetical protein
VAENDGEFGEILWPSDDALQENDFSHRPILIRIGFLKHSHRYSIFASIMLMPKIICIGVAHAKYFY